MTTVRRGPLPPCGFLVQAEKGVLPIDVEKRAKGKKVTLISNVQGNAHALCTTLTTLLGVGGTTHARGPKSDVEVQGEQVERVSRALKQLGCVRGLPPSKESAVVVQRECAYDGVLGEVRRKARHKEHMLEVPEPPLDAPCRRWHGDWMYCRGQCVQTDCTDVWLNCTSDPPVWAAPVGYIALDTALHRLGMLSEIGDSAKEWIKMQAKLAEDAAQKRQFAPTVDLWASTAPSSKRIVEREFVCEDCGAVFGLAKTLKKHRQQHQSVTPAAWPPVNDTSSWRAGTEEQNAAYEAEQLWEISSKGGDWAYDEYEVEEYQAPPAASLGSFMTLAKVNRKRPTKGPKAQNTTSTAMTVCLACPVCGDRFPEDAIHEHVDVCLAQPRTERVEDAFLGDNLLIPPELLESLLDLELSDAAVESFWCRYEGAAVGGAPPREAFLVALEATLDTDGGNVAVDICDPHQGDPEEQEWHLAGGSRSEKKRAPSEQHAKALATDLHSSVKTAEPRKTRFNQRAFRSPEKPSQETNIERPSPEPSISTPAPPSSKSSTSSSLSPPENTRTWLQRELCGLLGATDGEAIYAGIEVIMNNGDEDCRENAMVVLESVLPDGHDALVDEFRRRVGI